VVRLILVMAGAAAIPAGVHLGRWIQVELPAAAPVASPAVRAPNRLEWDSVGAALVSRDPFRASRSPAPLAYRPEVADAVVVDAAPPKPVLALSGIVWGTEPSVVVEGLPGVEGGTLMRPGETVSGIRLRRVTRDQAMLIGMDTTWVLSVRKPW
jgi:hypothetical protein